MSSELPWASVFDSAANMRALSAIQADGLRAASELVDRFVRMAAVGLGGLESSAPATPSGNGQQTDLYGATGLEPFVSSWWAMLDRFLKMSAPHPAGDEAEAAAPALDLTAQKATGRLQLTAVGSGTATAEVWLHNRGPVDMGKVVLRCSDLLSHQGTVLAAALMRLEPDIVPMPARCSRGVTVEVDVGDEIASGNYRGMLLTDGHPDVWLPVELVVTPLLP